MRHLLWIGLDTEGREVFVCRKDILGGDGANNLSVGIEEEQIVIGAETVLDATEHLKAQQGIARPAHIVLMEHFNAVTRSDCRLISKDIVVLLCLWHQIEFTTIVEFWPETGVTTDANI